ncbi:MAG: lysozyme [Pseudomonadota bacterium]
MRTSQTGVDLITRFEGFRARSEALVDGGHVIGFGHTRHAKANQKISVEDALTLLKGHDLPPIEKALAARSLAPLGQNEFDALVAFAFNIGLENFLDSDVFALVNSGVKLNAAEAMAAWRKARVDGRVIVVDALVRRRAAERALFLEVPGGPTPAATPIVRPILDLAAAILHPRDPSEGLAATVENQDVEEVLHGEEQVLEAPSRDFDEIPLESATEVAARNVTERLTRILGEDPAKRSGDDTPDDESVEEITRAVSALADPLDPDTQNEVESRQGDSAESPASGAVAQVEQVEDGAAEDPIAAAAIAALTAQLETDDPGQLDIRETGGALEPSRPLAPRTNGKAKMASGPEEIAPDPNPTNAAVVDDLEPLDFDDVAQTDPDTSRGHAPLGSLLLYGLSAFGGALIGAWGVKHLTDTMASTAPLQSDWALYAGPFAILIGGLIFLIMGYYLLQALFTEG